MTYPIFVGGTGRSGTTILAEILGKNADIFSFPIESRFIVDPGGLVELIPSLSSHWSPYIGSKAIFRFQNIMYNLYKNETLLDKAHRKILCDYLQLISPLKYKKLPLFKHIGKYEFKKITESFIDKLIDSQFKGLWSGTKSYQFKPKIISTKYFERSDLLILTRQFVNELVYQALIKNNKSMWLDHTPFNICHASFLKELFPDCKIIHIYRDPRDVICSYNTKSWGGEKIDDIITWIKQVHEKWFHEKAQLSDDDYLEVSFSEFINNHENTLYKINKFLNVDYSFTNYKISNENAHEARHKSELSKSQIELLNTSLYHILDYYNFCN